MNSFSPYHFAFFRIVLGVYLFIHFVMLIPYAAEVWGSHGIMPDPSLNFTYGVFPSILNVFDSSLFVLCFTVILALLSVMLVLGIYRPLVAILLWYGWVCLFDRNNLISNPGIPFVGWLLLVVSVVPLGEPLSITGNRKETEWKMSSVLFIGAWVIMALSYSISGIDKLMSPSWANGTAIIHLLENPLARNWWLREYLLGMPESFLHLMTWTILALEILFLPLAIFNRTRSLAWLSIIIMHSGILMIVDFADLTVGMLMIHVFTFDSKWLKPVQKDQKKRIVFFDGICGLCNSFIDLLMREDKQNVLSYAPLQGQTAKELIPESNLIDLDTIMYYDNGKLFQKSDAVLRILGDIGGIWKLALVFKVVPLFVRNKVYDFVAGNRYKWFGKKEACRMPTKEEREKILL